jgi:beta-lactamase class A
VITVDKNFTTIFYLGNMKKLPFFLLLICITLSAGAQKTDKRLTAILAPLLSAFNGQAGIYVHHLKSGRIVAINADTTFPTASMIKTAIQVGIFNKLAKGELQYHQNLVYRDSLLYKGRISWDRSGIVSR